MTLLGYEVWSAITEGGFETTAVHFDKDLELKSLLDFWYLPGNTREWDFIIWPRYISVEQWEVTTSQLCQGPEKDPVKDWISSINEKIIST